MVAPTPGEGRTDALKAVFVSLDKALRTIKLYRGQGDLVTRMQTELEQRLAAVVAQGDVTLRLSRLGMLYEGTQVSEPAERADHLFRLYCDGVRELTFTQGTDSAEVRGLLRILALDPNKLEDDLVTLLWREGFKTLRFYAVDSFAGGAEQATSSAFTSSGTGGLQRGTAGTEVALSPDDLRVLRADDRLGWVRLAAGRAPAPSDDDRALFTGLRAELEAPADLSAFVAVALRHSQPGEPSPLLLGQLDAAIGHGDASVVQALLQGFVAQRAVPQAAPLLKAALDVQRLKALSPLVTAHPDQLLEPLESLIAEVGQGLVALLLELPPGALQERLVQKLAEQGIDLTAFYIERLQSKDEASQLQAIEALGRLPTDGARSALATALGSSLTRVRTAALQALAGRYDDSIRVPLGKTLRDPLADNRLMALDLLVASKDPKATYLLVSAMQDAKFATLEVSEQERWMKGLAAFKDPRSVKVLQQVFTERSLGKNEALERRQLAAVAALREVGGDAAKAALEALAKDWLAARAVKDAAKAALGAWGSR